MVEEKAAAGRRALSAWVNRCKTEVGDVGVSKFKKLMIALVDSVMLYGVEICGHTRGLEAIEQVQMPAFCMFFGVGTLHPKVSLMMELESILYMLSSNLSRPLLTLTTVSATHLYLCIFHGA